MQLKKARKLRKARSNARFPHSFRMLNHSSLKFNLIQEFPIIISKKNSIFHLSKLFIWKVADEKPNFYSFHSGFSFGYFTYIFPLHLIHLGRITVRIPIFVHHTFLLPAFTSKAMETFAFPYFRKLLLQRAFFAAFFREILTCHLHEFLRNSRDDISASGKQFSGHIYYVSKQSRDDFGLIEKLFVRRKVYCSTFSGSNCL